MSCCKINEREFQRIPRSNPRTILVDAALPGEFEDETGNVFCYKLTSIAQLGDELEQRGCGPNFQGERITLCTCMRYHRTWPSIGKGTWIAGFSGNRDANELFYLMKVEKAFENFALLWYSGDLPDVHAKSASNDVFGDVYEPLSADALANGHNPDFYRKPIEHHKHENEWHRDIDLWHGRKSHKKAVHKLLMGEPSKSFVWRHPRYKYKPIPHPRFQLFQTVSEFYKHLH